jgi:hypothetical protein
MIIRFMSFYYTTNTNFLFLFLVPFQLLVANCLYRNLASIHKGLVLGMKKL